MNRQTYRLEKSLPNGQWLPLDSAVYYALCHAKAQQEHAEKQLGQPWLIRVVDGYGVTVA